MIRTRLVWFTSGFLLTGGTIAYYLHRDLSKDRYLLVEQLKDNFGALESRVSNLESPHNAHVQVAKSWKLVNKADDTGLRSVFCRPNSF